jgi:hypothetical protein
LIGGVVDWSMVFLSLLLGIIIILGRLGARTDLGAPCHQGLEVVLCLVDDGGKGRVGG